MKIDKLASVSIKKVKSPEQISTNGFSFDAIKKEIANLLLDKSSPLSEIENRLTNTNNLSGKDLLSFQIRASNYHMKVEVVSKVAESLIATTRRLQQVQ